VTLNRLEILQHKDKPISTIETSIGTLCLFSISVDNQSSLIKALNVSINEVSPQEYVKNLSVFVCYPESILKDGKYKPDEPVLTLKEIHNLSEADLEVIAETYVINNEYLFKKLKLIKKVADNGEEITSSEYSDVVHPKNDDESYIYYLHRLSCLEQEKQRDTIKSIVDSMPKIDGFSTALSGGIKNNMILGNSLTKSIEAAKSISKIGGGPSASTIETMNLLSELSENKEKVRREPFDDLAKKLDTMIDLSHSAAEFMVDANKIQTGIATEIKAGGDVTDGHARRNIWLSVLVLILSFLGLGLTGWSNYSGVSFSKQQQKALDSYTSEISENLALSTKTVKDNGGDSKLILTEILASLNLLNGNLTNNQKRLEEIIRERDDALKLSSEQYKSEIELLNKEVERLHNEAKQSSSQP
jgi:hypothetical protein